MQLTPRSEEKSISNPIVDSQQGHQRQLRVILGKMHSEDSLDVSQHQPATLPNDADNIETDERMFKLILLILHLFISIDINGYYNHLAIGLEDYIDDVGLLGEEQLGPVLVEKNRVQ